MNCSLFSGGETEEIFLPYEDNEIFSYLDNQEVCFSYFSGMYIHVAYKKLYVHVNM